MKPSPPPQLDRANAIQSELTGKPQSAFSLHLNSIIYEKAVLAASDVRSANDKAPIYVIPADTGSGKTTFTCGLITAFYEADPTYTAAYLVGTIREAQSVYDYLSKHLPSDALYIHTTAHASADLRQLEVDYGEAVAKHVECNGTSTQSSLGKHRVIVCTHALWIKEGNEGCDLGIRLYGGSTHRSNIFVDEQPEFVTTEEAAPSAVAFLREQTERVSDWHAALALIDRIYDRMVSACRANGAKFETCHLLDRQEYAVLDVIEPALLNDDKTTKRMSASLRFLEAASRGCSFLARGHHGGEVVEGVRRRTGFIAYRLQFRPHPGLIILDATAATSAFASLHRNVQLAEVPPVNYAKLALTHIEAPTQFKNIASCVTGPKNDTDYIRWVRETVKDNTNDGEHVLVVVHKRHAEQLAAMDSQGAIKGRFAHYNHWGTGIGCNDWRKCTSVFLFSEFHLPRSVYLSDALAMREREATADEIKAVIGQCVSGVSAIVAQGHRLRWFKQMGCRGRVRDIDEQGKCGSMKLFTTMERSLFVKSHRALFPGAPEPKFITSDQAERRTKGEELEALLINCKRLELCASELAGELGWKVKEVGRVFRSTRCASLRWIGWEFIKGNGRASKPILRRTPTEIYLAGVKCTI